jgi:GST-like protein
VLNQNLATRKYICGDEYTVADIAIWPWYGALVLGRMYGSREFLSVDTEYPHLKRWAAMLEEERAPIRRGRMVNRGNVRNEPGDSNPLYAELPNLPERHARSDWQLKGK